MMKSYEIRDQFIEFFKGKGHRVVRSSSVVPSDDPTLLFTNAGMNQFKEFFLGKRTPGYKRAVNSQKCIRAGGKHNDLEEVGKDGTHHTFFEMLGNWSFGDYYKREAIKWAWELLTEVWGLSKERLHATVHDSDKEAYDLWREETDINHNHIYYQGDKDNFWEMGDTGPCGPCSEIHYDLGNCSKSMKEDHQCVVNGECDRYIEIWNLVFIQFYRDTEGSLNPLPEKFVDTGAGFERLCMVMQNKRSNYETDLFQPVISAIEEISGIKCEPMLYDGKASSHLVIADHIRMLCVALADGAYPSNEGRGYILRRILRRASRYGRLIGLVEPFLYRLTGIVVQTLGIVYEELAEKESYIQTIIRAEEERFNLTLDKGLEIFGEICNRDSSEEISGKDVFLLYDTYGFPPDLTALLASEKGKMVDIAGFNNEMDNQRNLAKAGSNFGMKEDNSQWITLSDAKDTEFVGYSQSHVEARILKYSLSNDHDVKIVLDKTPFYAESGGQVADKGFLLNDVLRIEIYTVEKEAGRVIHHGKIIEGTINPSPLIAQIDESFRQSIKLNHTATHLLHSALRDLLGNHVQQKGSLVSADHLRFDFTHFSSLTEKEIEWLEEIINKNIRLCLPVVDESMDYEMAKAEGAIALFGEKYEDIVRTIKIKGVSMELCGGTHVQNTGEIGLFKIKTETASASGIRRIEAVTGYHAELYVRSFERIVSSIAAEMRAPVNTVFDRVLALIEENKQLNKSLAKMQNRGAGQEVEQILKKALFCEGTAIVAGLLSTNDSSVLRSMGDLLRDKIGSGIGLLAIEGEGKVSLIVIVTEDLTQRVKAGQLASQVAEIVGGKGGGRADMAMAGGKDVDKVIVAIERFPELVRKALKRDC